MTRRPTTESTGTEKIVAIAALELAPEPGVRWNSVSGFLVQTTEQEIKLMIDNEAACCENFGYFWTNDKPEDFIGATLLDVTITDKELKTRSKNKRSHLPSQRQGYDGDVLFVNLATDRGILQFTAYNEHNGNYGHTASVECRQLKYAVTV